jgi:hypothetical protein
MVAGHDLVNVLAETVVVPDIGAEEFLQSPWGDIVEEGNGFNTLAGQVTKLAAEVMVEVLTGFGAAKAIGEFVEEIRQSGPQSLDLFGGHP